MPDTNDNKHSLGTQRSLEELHELVTLAEQVSYDLEKSRLYSLRQILIMSGTAFVVSLTGLVLLFSQKDIVQTNFGLPITSLTFALLLAPFLLTYTLSLLTANANSSKWRTEREIISEIVIMSSSILERVQNNISSVEYTVFRMRLRRINLTGKNQSVLFGLLRV